MVDAAGDLLWLADLSNRLLVVRLNEELEVVWRRQVDVRTDDDDARSFVSAIAAAPEDRVYVAFSTTGPWQGRRSNGSQDAFWLILGRDGYLVQ